VVWSLTDPIFRTVANSGKLAYKEEPTQVDALSAAGALNADYVLVVQARRDVKLYKGKLELFKGGKSTYKDEQNISVTSASQTDLDSSLRSLARTLVLRLDAAALKGLAAARTTSAPPLDPGQAPVDIKVAPAEPLKKDNTPLLRNAQSMLADKRTSSAIALLRDAVDSDPLALELRTALINALLLIDPGSAAIEARNAASLLPEAADLRVLAAKSWLRAGRPEEAQNDLNEAIARNPEGLQTRILLGEIGVMQLKPERSLDHLSKAIAAEDSAEARYLRAFAYALAGSSEPMRADLDQLAKLEPKTAPDETLRRYTFASEILDRSLQLDGNAVRALIQRAIVKPNDKAVLEAVDTARRQIKARAAFGERLALPDNFKLVQEQRLLAYKLMAQSLTDLLGFMAGGAEESLADARINLGEALRNATEARAAEVKARS
jgi:tetratricopeptide (TPR) repeat protein